MKSLFAVIATLALGACAMNDERTASAGVTSGAGAEAEAEAMRAAEAPPAAPDYLRMAGASDLFEIQSSQALLQSSQNYELRRYATMMVDHHSRTTQQLAAAAQAAGMTAPAPLLDTAKADMLRQLQAASGSARDRLYAIQQVTAHKEALALHDGYGAGGDNAQLRAVATQTVPIIQQHLADIERIAAAMG